MLGSIFFISLPFIQRVASGVCDTNVLNPLSSVVHTASKLSDLLLGSVLGVGNGDDGRHRSCTLPGGVMKHYPNRGQWSGTPYPRCDIPITFRVYGLSETAEFTRDQLSSTTAMLENGVFKSTNFDQRPLFVVTHGFFSEKFPAWMSKAKDSLLAQGFNVVLLLWDSKSNGNVPDYYGSVADTRIVSDILALFVKILMEHGVVSIEKVVLVGHSLGAHICGMAGRQIPGLRGVIGLDPAGPFFDCHPDIGLTRSSAKIVQILHTDFVGLSRYGTNMDRGHIDFYANKDKGVQPGCPPTTPPLPLVDPFTTYICNHFRAVFIFNEAISINATCHFVAVQKTQSLEVFSPSALVRLFDKELPRQPVLGSFVFDTASDRGHLCQKG